MRRVFEQLRAQAAERAGVAVVPAMGFDYVPGDMIASLTAEGMGEVDELLLAYDVKGFGATRGTMLSALEMLKGGDVEWRKLQWLPGRPEHRARQLRVPRGDRPQAHDPLPGRRAVTVPRHIATRARADDLSASTIAPTRSGPALPLLDHARRPRDAHAAPKRASARWSPAARGPEAPRRGRGARSRSSAT